MVDDRLGWVMKTVFILACSVALSLTACPPVPADAKVVRTCDMSSVTGSRIYLDSSEMASDIQECSCNLTSTATHGIRLKEVFETDACQEYYYNVSIILGNDRQSISYENDNGTCDFPEIMGAYLENSPPWIFTLARKYIGQQDPDFCLMAFAQTNEFTISCGDVVYIQTTTEAQTTTTTEPTTTEYTTSSTTDQETESTTDTTTSDTSSGPPVTLTTPNSGSSPESPGSTLTSGRTMSSITSDQPGSTTTSRGPGSTITPSSDKPGSTTNGTEDATTPRSTSKSTEPDLKVVVGASVASIVLFIILLSACIYMTRKRSKVYTRKDVSNVVYVVDK